MATKERLGPHDGGVGAPVSPALFFLSRVQRVDPVIRSPEGLELVQFEGNGPSVENEYRVFFLFCLQHKPFAAQCCHQKGLLVINIVMD